MSDNIRLIGGAKGVDHLAENKRHDWLRDTISDGADGAECHQHNVEPIGECEEFIERDLLTVSSIPRTRRQVGRGVAAVHGGSSGCKSRRRD